jgi:hypothetical protein
MNAGRELDALVAERVMGWELRSVGAPSLVWTEKETGIGRSHEDQWNPSVSIHYAWQVVVKMLAREQAHIDLSIEPGGVHCFYSSYEQEVDALGPSAPVAICLAALKAVGVEVES